MKKKENKDLINRKEAIKLIRESTKLREQMADYSGLR